MDFTLRKWREEDIPAVVKHADNKAIAANLRDGFPHPYTEEDSRAYILSCLQADPDKKRLYAIAVNDEAVGSIGIFRGEDVYRCGAELGYWLAEHFWGKGIMTRAIMQITEEVFAQSDIIRIYAEPYAHNTGSRRALEKAGYVLEGVLHRNAIKYGDVLDSCIYARLRT